MTDFIQSLTRLDQISDVLRYWLSAVRFEEALTVRPRAHRVSTNARLDIREPKGNQPYFKLPLFDDDGRFSFKRDAEVYASIVGERVPFTEQWLRRMYRRQKNRWSLDQESFGGVVGWPTVYFPRREELASVFRFRVSLEWLDDEGQRFEPPRYRERKGGRYPAPPTRIRLRSVVDEEDGLLPFSSSYQS